jgi:hypothetical protein
MGVLVHHSTKRARSGVLSEHDHVTLCDQLNAAHVPLLGRKEFLSSTNKEALVSGGSGGIGAGIAKRLGACGFTAIAFSVERGRMAEMVGSDIGGSGVPPGDPETISANDGASRKRSPFRAPRGRAMHRSNIFLDQ